MLAPTNPTGGSAGAGITFALSPRLSKPAGPQTRQSEDKLISPFGGEMAAWNNGTVARFIVPRKALDRPTWIRMDVLGSGPSVVVQFGPSGLQFNTPCTLAISMPADGVDPSSLGGYVNEASGATPVPYTVEVHGDRITVKITVPHFSIYSPGDGDGNLPPETGTGGGTGG